MTSAIALSKELYEKKGKRSYSAAFGSDDVNPIYRPRFMSIEEASQVPSKPVRDELVKLYFQHFHPFCPVVDEFDFMEIYEGIENEEELKKRVDLSLFQAMMFVAIGVRDLNLKQFPLSKKTTVHVSYTTSRNSLCVYL